MIVAGAGAAARAGQVKGGAGSTRPAIAGKRSNAYASDIFGNNGWAYGRAGENRPDPDGAPERHRRERYTPAQQMLGT
jgi:hypothetical protein